MREFSRLKLETLLIFSPKISRKLWKEVGKNTILFLPHSINDKVERENRRLGSPRDWRHIGVNLKSPDIMPRISSTEFEFANLFCC